MKLKRGTFTAIFFLACIAALELEQVVLEKIWSLGVSIMERRVFLLCLLSFLMFAEALSWWTAGGLGPCLVESEHSQQAASENEHEDCPTFFAGSLLSFERGYEWIKRDDNDKAVVAAFTVVLAISTIGLWFATIKLWQAGEKQFSFTRQSIDLARDEFNATHRPKIRVKHCVLAEDIWQNQPIVIALTCVNHGTSDAFLQQVGVRYFVVRQDRQLPIETAIPAVFGAANARLQSGLNYTFDSINTGRILTPEENSAIQNRSAQLFCVGYVSYFDAAGRMRITGFCRVLIFPNNDIIAHWGNGRFRLFDDPDYEYQD